MAIIVILCVVARVSQMVEDMGEKFEWGDVVLGEVLPKPEGNRGDIHSNGKDMLSMDVNMISRDEYKEYVMACEERSFTVESDKSENRYSAYNEDGYELTLSYYESMKELSISLESPLELKTLEWPANEMVGLLPVPGSTVGLVKKDSSDEFAAYVGETPAEAYAEYVNQCMESGFTLDYDKGSRHFKAGHEQGYKIAVNYSGNSVMYIEIEKMEEPTTAVTEAITENMPIQTTMESVQQTTSNAAGKSDAELVDGMRPEFKAAMDSYEAFYGEYCTFMKEYSTNSTDLKLIAKYGEMIIKLAQMDKAFQEWNEEELNDAELRYYLAVNNRILQMMAEIQ